MKSLILALISLFIINSLCYSQSTNYPNGVTGCIARWDFSSNGAITSLPDVSGNNNNGTSYNLTTANGFRNIPNAAMKFDGSSSYAQVPNSTQLCPQQMTMIALVKFNGFYSGHCQGNQIVGKGWPYYLDGDYNLYVSDNPYDGSCDVYSPNKDEMSAAFSSASYIFTQPPEPFIDTSSWILLAGSYDGNTVKYYQIPMDINNYNSNIIPLYTLTNLNTPIGVNSLTVDIGYSSSPTFPYWFDGAMDELVLFNKALTDSEVQSVYDYLWGIVTIDNPTTDTSLCLGNSFNVHYTTQLSSVIFQSNNIFTVQLSDASGSFTSPIAIGSITATSSGSIPCIIPTNIPAGNGYKIRLVASNPAYTIENPIHLSLGTLAAHTVTGSNTPVCVGGTLDLTASNTTPGVTYTWIGPNGFNSTSQNPIIPNTIMADSGTYTVVTSIPGCTDTATVLGAIIQQLTEGPTAIIYASPRDTFCTGDTITFTSYVDHPGFSPTYQWKKNGSNITGATNSSYITHNLSDGDNITCVVTVNDPCVTIYTATSNVIVMHELTLSPPTLSITSNPPVAGPGTTITFTAHVSSVTGITFQWRKNGLNIPTATTSSYTTNTLNTGDQVTVMIHSSVHCVSPDTVVSNTITLDVNTVNDNLYNLQLYPNPTGGNITLTGKINNSISSTTIDIVNTIGQVVYTTELQLNGKSLNEKISLPDNIPSGFYLMRVTAGEQKQAIPFTLSR